MNKIYSLLIFLLAISVQSCTTHEKITVKGKPGTSIYTPQKELIGTIDNSGSVALTLNGDHYFAYLLSKSQGSDKYIPFALDYKNINTSALKASKYLGYGIGMGGSLVMLTGLIPLIAGAEDIATPWILTGAGLTLGGLAIGMPAMFRLDNLNKEYRFSYLKTQNTNEQLETLINGYPKRSMTSSPAMTEPHRPEVTKEEHLPQSIRQHPKQTGQPENSGNQSEHFIHTTMPGETLQSIAEIYNVRVADIIRWNKLSGNKLTEGMNLIIKFE